MMLAWLPLLLLATKIPLDAPALHRVEVNIAGPLAMVEVWRAVEANVRSAGDKQSGTHLDLNLPDGAALLDFEIIEGKTGTRLAAVSEVEASAALAAGLKLRGLALPPTPAEEGTDLRLHLTPIADGERAVLHYRYSAIATCKDGRLVVRVPESLEESPVPSEVSVTFAPPPDGLGLAAATVAGKPAEIGQATRKLVVQGTAPARAAWEIAWTYAKSSGSLPGVAVAAAARVPGLQQGSGRARSAPAYALAGLVCRTEPATLRPAPARVVLVVDRSRSVGQGGLSAERLLARQIIETLPPMMPFDAILFGGAAEPVFPLPRLPTREALDAFTNAADPNRLDNGTDVAGALERVRGFVASSGGDDRIWVVVLTDGALPPGQTFERMAKALGAAGAGTGVHVLVLLVRQHGDEEVPPEAVAEYAGFARAFGGLVRVVAPESPRETARALVTAMVKGGDLLDLRLEEGKLAASLPPLTGAAIAFTTRARLPGNPRVRVTARGLDGDVRAELQPVTVKREWLEPLLDRRPGKRRAWTGATSGMAVSVLPGPIGKPTPDGVVRGRMDPGVLRNALALAFTPRARACYLSRRVAKASDAFLQGRLKLELTIERGELHDAVVRQSTLGHPDIEDCVRRAAWAVEYPRPEHRDAPTVANVNLVFSPKTPKESAPDASTADRDIELILGPLTFPQDYQDLLDRPAPEKSTKP